jgi:flagellar biosynthesis protein FlhG
MMADQANKLRDLVKQRLDAATEKPKHVMTSRMITVASGKGGVGKSNFAVNLAIAFRKMDKRVIVVDADFGLANVEVLLGINPKYNVSDILSGLVDMEAALTVGPLGIMFLSGGSGLTALSDVTEQELAVLIDSFEQLDEMADIIIIDTGAGISRSVVNFIKATPETIIVTTPDPTAVTDAYALIKNVKDTANELPELKLVVNRVENPAEGLDVYEKLSMACDRFLSIKLNNLGSIPNDPRLVKAVKRQQPVTMLYPTTESTLCIGAICAKLLQIEPTKPKTGIRLFITKLMGRWG